MKKERRSKQRQIANDLRERIVRGDWRPGEMLPPRLELASELGVSVNTLQRAFDHLADDGFISAKGGQGTFVSSRPPHLSQYGLVFHSNPQDPVWGRFAQVMLDEAVAMERGGDIKFPCYFGIQGSSDSEDYQKLARDMQQHRLAGVIFTDSAPAEQLNHSRLVDDPGVPCVAVMGPSASTMPRVELDGLRFYERAVEYLVRRGRRSIAVLIKSGRWPEKTLLADLDRVMSLPGVIHKPYWRQHVDVFDSESVKNAVHLLLHTDQQTRPDGLIVADDTMLDAATIGLLIAGVRVPQEVEVVSHFNFPVRTPSQLPVTRLGFDARLVLDVCLDMINRQRNGETLDGTSRIVPVTFESELKSNLPPLVAAIKAKAASAV